MAHQPSRLCIFELAGCLFLVFSNCENQSGQSEAASLPGRSAGRPDRTAEEIAAWARAHDLPYEDGHVRFPDARLEVEEADGRWTREDIEVVTRHYRGAHAARAARGGVRTYRASGLGQGRGGGAAMRRGGRARRGGLADEVLR